MCLGTIDAKELKVAMRALGFEPKKEEIKASAVSVSVCLCLFSYGVSYDYASFFLFLAKCRR